MKIDPDTNLSKYGEMWLCDNHKDQLYPPASVMCFMRCGRIVTSPVELTKKQPRCNECAALAATQQAQMRIDLDVNKVREFDSSMEVSTELFNAETTSILDIKKLIEDDDAIINKPYHLAETLKNRFMKNRELIFNLQKQIADENTKQRAIQSYLNTMANQLRNEEREKLHIADMNYQPLPTKKPSVKTIKTTGQSSQKKYTNKEISDAAKQLGIAEFTLKAFVLTQNGDLTAAVDKIKKSMEAARQQSN